MYSLIFEKGNIGDYATAEEAEKIRRKRIDEAPDHVREQLILGIVLQKSIPPKPEDVQPPNSHWNPQLRQWIQNEAPVKRTVDAPPPSIPVHGSTPVDNSGLVDLGGGLYVHKDKMPR